MPYDYLSDREKYWPGVKRLSVLTSAVPESKQFLLIRVNGASSSATA
jgi:hypothetical protein